MYKRQIYHCNSGCDGRNIENIQLNLSEILPVNLVDRLHLSVAVTGNRYCIFGRVGGHRTLVTVCGKFTAVGRGIWWHGSHLESVTSDVVLESGSVLESDSSTYFEDSDSNPLDSDSSPLDSDSNPRTRLDSRCSGIGLSTV